MGKTWGKLAARTIAVALAATPATPAAAQEEGRPAADVPPRKIIRTQRLRVPADLLRFSLSAHGLMRAAGFGLTDITSTSTV
jgi:hypothetical protein